jgi:hypothetical protein
MDNKVGKQYEIGEGREIHTLWDSCYDGRGGM